MGTSLGHKYVLYTYIDHLGRLYLEGHGDLVSKLIIPITHIKTPVIPLINLLTKSP